MQMGRAAVLCECETGREGERERAREKQKMCERRETFKRRHNGQHLQFSFRSLRGDGAGELSIAKALKNW